jgi:hypothetical protein
MRYRLRTLFVLLAVGPPAIAWGWTEYAKYQARQRAQEPEVVIWTPSSDKVIQTYRIQCFTGASATNCTTLDMP